MKIIIAEPMLRRRGGHPFDHAIRLAREFSRRGHTVETHAYRNLEDDVARDFAAEGLSLHRTFACHPFIKVDGPAGKPQWQYHVEDVRAVLPSLADADFIYWQSLTPEQAYALALDPPQMRGAGMIDGHFARADLDGAKIMATALAMLRGKRHQLAFGVFDVEVAKACREVIGDTPMGFLPDPIDVVPDTNPPRTVLRRLGFFGHQRPERGGDILLALAANLLKKGYEVVLQNSSQIINPGFQHPNLILEGFVPDVAAAMQGCDALVWPSNPQRYRRRGSGIVPIAIACGLPVVMPRDCVPGRVLARSGAGVLYDRNEMGAILQSVDLLAQNFAAINAAARTKALAWSQMHTCAALADALLAPSLPPLPHS
ncbi:MAG TPA: hypothetical protein DCL54_12540 [Alphaproteobacteria bacterium]|nr:hypothetical protein [Alphaproteobacteria bacterium]HAJ47397.1 hypothetical protein [Alphaproteobacteria bacterium]